MTPSLVGASRLDLVCRRCTRGAAFPAPSIEAAVQAAIADGWRMKPAAPGWPEHYTCPKCSGHRKNDGFRNPDVMFSDSFENGLRRDIDSIIRGSEMKVKILS